MCRDKEGTACVRHPHVRLIRLLVVRCRGFNLGRGRGLQEFPEQRHVKFCTAVVDKHAQISFTDTANGIQVGAAAVVFGKVTTQAAGKDM